MFAVLHLPGALRAFLPTLLGRSALAMAGLALLLAVQKSTGSFADAGFASAAFGIANVVAAPWRARIIDRWGQRRALTSMAVAQSAAFVGLAVTAAAPHVPLLLFLVLSIAVGISAPPLGAAMRVLWASLTTVGDQRKKAFSLDAVAEELLFVAGPVVVAAIITATSASTALLVTGLVVLIGTIGLTTSAVSGAQVGAVLTAMRSHRPLRQPGFTRVLLVLVAVGGVLGVVEIAAPAVAEQQAAVAASGWLLAAFAVGSAIGGVIYGHVHWKASLGVKLFILCVSMGAAAVIVSQAGSLLLFAAGLVLLGLFLAPSLVTGYLVADAIVPENSRTEASTWINTAVNLGASLAAAAAGVLIDASGSWLSLLLVGALAVAIASLVPFRRLRAIEG